MTPSPASLRNTPPDEVAIAVGPREQLFHLLAEAAEIEHTLMCVYLYAAFSLKLPASPGLSKGEGEALSHWRKTIVSVAKDEMVHLMLVANLSVAIGGRPHFSRPNFPVAPGYFPSGVVVKLTPFNAETLKHMIYLERPQGIELEDGVGFEHEDTYQREEAYVGLMPSIQDYNTVGRLYEAIRTNLTASAHRLGETNLFIGPVSSQVGPELVELDGVSTIGNLESALSAIDTIVEQGEGAPGDRADSHYQKFLSIQNRFRELCLANPEFDPAESVAESPVMRRPPEPTGKVFVDHPPTAIVLDYANAVYNLLLRCLVQAFGQQPDARGITPSVYLGVAIGLMHVLDETASALVQMPASESTPGVNAGISFTTLRGVEPLLIGAAERILVLERLTEIRDGAEIVGRAAPSLRSVGNKLTQLISTIPAR